MEEGSVLRLILIHDQGSKKRIQKEDESRARCEIDREGHGVRAEHTSRRPPFRPSLRPGLSVHRPSIISHPVLPPSIPSFLPSFLSWCDDSTIPEA